MRRSVPVVLVCVLAACSEPLTAPAPGDLVPSFTALAGGGSIYRFNDLGGPQTCEDWHRIYSYQDLSLVDYGWYAVCAAPGGEAGDFALVPSALPATSGYTPRIALPHPATRLGIRVYLSDSAAHPILYGLHDNNAAVAYQALPLDAPAGQWYTLQIDAPPGDSFDWVWLKVHAQWGTYWDDLKVDVYDPVTSDDCRKGRWEDFGFKNQGQCVRFVETGKDSR